MKEEIIKVCCVRVSVPKAMLNKAFDEHRLIDHKTYLKNRRKLAEIETAINQLKNVQSIVERINERWIAGSPLPCFTLQNTHTL